MRKFQLGELQVAAKQRRTRGYCWRPDVEQGLTQAMQLLPEARRVAEHEVEQASKALIGRIENLARDARVVSMRVGNLVPYVGTSDAAPPASPLLGVPLRWPESCSSCNARLVVPVRGQTILICAYCTTEHHITIGRVSAE